MFPSTGPCRSNELANSRERRHDNKTDTFFQKMEREVAQVHDPYDTAIYEAARERFWSDVRKYELDHARCEKVCQGYGTSSVAAAASGSNSTSAAPQPAAVTPNTKHPPKHSAEQLQEFMQGMRQGQRGRPAARAERAAAEKTTHI